MILSVPGNYRCHKKRIGAMEVGFVYGRLYYSSGIRDVVFDIQDGSVVLGRCAEITVLLRNKVSKS